MKHWLFLFLLAVSCKKETAPQPQNATEALTKGSWVVSNCFIGGAGATAQYEGHVFTFKTNGEVSVIKNGVETLGLWSEGGGNPATIDLVFSRGATPELVAISLLWQQESIAAGKVSLRFGIGAQPDRLTFTKR
jgi:hypothetical protein